MENCYPELVIGFSPGWRTGALVIALLGPAVAAGQGLPLFAPLDTSAVIAYRIEISPDAAAVESGDAELCRWALEDWARASGGVLQFSPAGDGAPLVEIHFVPAQYGQYGEMRPLEVDGRRGAAVYIRPDTDALGPDVGSAAREDPLFRDTIVYLTCLHELGHAVGLEHTDGFADIMYFFGFGGDVREYFGRYRARLTGRDDIAAVSGLSSEDTRRLLALYPR